MTERTIGIDISKLHLDAYRMEDQTAKRFENSRRGLQALFKWLGTTPVARIVFEPTGPYHRAFEKALSGKFPLVKVNPLQARRFAEACGTRARQTRSMRAPSPAWAPRSPWNRMSQSRRSFLNSETGRLLAQLWSRSAPACETAAMFKAMPF